MSLALVQRLVLCLPRPGGLGQGSLLPCLVDHIGSEGSATAVAVTRMFHWSGNRWREFRNM